MRTPVFVFGLSLVLAPAYAVSAADTTGAPKQVFVVNTQDASVSLVDLATMKELKRHKVGDRPYGIAVSQDGKTVAVGVEDEDLILVALHLDGPRDSGGIARRFGVGPIDSALVGSAASASTIALVHLHGRNALSAGCHRIAAS